MSHRNPSHPHLLKGPHLAPTHNFVSPLRLLLEHTGLEVELNLPSTLVGRHSQANVRLALPDVSRRHCRLIWVDGQWKVVDLKSLNGVYVNDRRTHETTLYHGDRLRIGGITFVILLDSSNQRGKPTGEANQKLQSIVDALPDARETVAHKSDAA